MGVLLAILLAHGVLLAILLQAHQALLVQAIPLAVAIQVAAARVGVGSVDFSI